VARYCASTVRLKKRIVHVGQIRYRHIFEYGTLVIARYHAASSIIAATSTAKLSLLLPLKLQSCSGELIVWLEMTRDGHMVVVVVIDKETGSVKSRSAADVLQLRH
jgi:hypothetical protein